MKCAKDTGSYIIQDDYDGVYRYKGKPIPALQGLGTRVSVIYILRRCIMIDMVIIVTL